MGEPLVSVIIVNWNGGQVLADCLESIKNIQYTNWELIIVDNGSIDRSIDIIKQSKSLITNIQLIKNKSNLGFAKANNQAVKKCKGKYVLLLNNDTKVEPNFLPRLVVRMEEDVNIGVIQPKIFLMDQNLLDNAGSYLTRIGFLEHWGFGQRDKKQFQNERVIFSAKGACMLIRKEVINQVGLFDNDFFAYFEESDFCWRVWLAGYRIIFYPNSVIYHKLGFTIRRLGAMELNYHYYKNRICSLIKNLEPGNLILILVPHLFISSCLIVLFLLKLKFKYAFMIIKAFFWNLQNLTKTLQKRQKVQLLRKVSDRDLFSRILHEINWQKFINDFRRVQVDLKRPSQNVRR